MKCTNCGARLTCSCQQRTATNGKSVCSNCITAYEASLRPNAVKDNKPIFIWDVQKGNKPN